MNEVSNALKAAIGEAVRECEECARLREQVRELRAQVSSRDRLIQTRGYDLINSTREDVVVPAFPKPFRQLPISNEVGQEGSCFYCDSALHISTITEDHFIPRSKGGKGYNCIKVLACTKCNQRKGNRMPTEAEWRKLLSRLQGKRRAHALDVMLSITADKTL